MDVKCDKCQARYRIDDARVGAAGLTMRCGKCSNTFKVTKGGATQSVGAAGSAPPPAAKPAPAAPAGPAPENSTMMFAAPVIPPAKPAATKPPPAAAKPSPRAMPEDAAGSTMMFAAAPVAPPSKPAPAKAAPPAAKPAPDSDAGSTMMFAAAPVVAAKTDASAAAKAAAAKAAAKAAPADAAGATMMFAAAPQPAAPPKAKPAPVALPDMMTEPGAPPRDDEPVRTQAPRDDEPEEQEAQAAPEPTPPPPRRPSAPIAPMAREESVADDGIVAEGAEHTLDTPLVPQPKKFPVVPVAIAAGLIVVILVALFAVKRFGKQLPKPDALEQMAQAHSASLKDTAADYAVAEGLAKGALQLNERAFFPVGWAELAEIEVGWADALRDANGSASEVKGRLNAALNAINSGLKQDPQNADLMIAQADYYRSAGSSSSYGKAMKKAQSLAANDARVAFVQGLAAAAEDDGAEKALPLLKSAAAGLGGSARVHYRYALALIAAKQDDAAGKELAEALKISPAHDRARKLQDEQKAKGGGAAPPQEAPPPAEAPKGAKKGK